MPSKVFSATVIGLDSQVIEIETDVSYGLHCFNIVGLPDKAVAESKDRVASAIKNSNFRPPQSQPQKVLVSLAPADLKKEGSLYDLPIALGYLAAAGQIKFNPQGRIIIGELSLDGQLRPAKGVISLAQNAREQGWLELILPKANAQEAALIQSLNPEENDFRIIGVNSLLETIDYLTNRVPIEPLKINFRDFINIKPSPAFDLGWIKGQESSKRALEISAAGGHNLLMVGPPGTGKSLLAQSLPSILPDLGPEEILEITKIYSVAGLLPPDAPFITTRPFRAPHHTSSEVSLIGGGNPPRPGEITLAHRGVLFLDEFPEFHRDVLESLRQPLEEGKISVLRAKHHLTFPSCFTLVAAANPCPCGYWRDPNKTCQCVPSQVAKYRRKLSGPLIDRIDLFINVPQIKFEKLTAPETDISVDLRTRVNQARQIQRERYKTSPRKVLINAEMGLPEIKKYCQVGLKSQGILRQFVDAGKLSARGYHRVLKVARTVADLARSAEIQYEHLTEALMYRIQDQ